MPIDPRHALLLVSLALAGCQAPTQKLGEADIPAGRTLATDGIGAGGEVVFAVADAEAECRALLAKGDNGGRQLMVLPAYDQAIKASHIFNLLDARGVISVTERQAYILRVRDLAKACCAAWLKTEAGGANG